MIKQNQKLLTDGNEDETFLMNTRDLQDDSFKIFHPRYFHYAIFKNEIKQFHIQQKFPLLFHLNSNLQNSIKGGTYLQACLLSLEF